MFQQFIRSTSHRLVLSLTVIAICASLFPLSTAIAAESVGADTSATANAVVPADDSIVAIINDRPITKAAFYSYIENAYGISALTQLIADALLEEAAEERSIVISDIQVQQQFDAIKAGYESETDFLIDLMDNNYTEASLKYRIRMDLILNLLAFSGVTVTEQEVQTYFDENKDFLGTPAQSRVSHILVDTLEEAQKLVAQIKAGGDFAALAKEFSMDTASATTGGDLGYIGDNDAIVAEFRNAMNELALGQLSEPVQSSFGYHIIMITERKLAQPAQLDKVRQDIRTTIAQEKALSYEEVLQGLFEQFKVNVLWEKYQILGN